MYKNIKEERCAPEVLIREINNSLVTFKQTTEQEIKVLKQELIDQQRKLNEVTELVHELSVVVKDHINCIGSYFKSVSDKKD